MRKSTLAGAVLALVAAAPSTAVATPGDDLVAGSAKGIGLHDTALGAFPSQAHVNAKGDATDATGHYFTRIDTGVIGTLEHSGSALCINAVGNTALVKELVETSNSPFTPVGSAIFRKVVDNGSGRNDPPDESAALINAPVAGDCPPPDAVPIATNPIDQGNFVVRDGG
jgi:hypothetical protein